MVACTREKPLQNADPTIEQILKKYQFVRMPADYSDLFRALPGQPIFTKIENELDLTQVELLESAVSKTRVYIIGFKNNPDKKYAIKAIVIKNLVVLDEILFSRKMTDLNNGQIGILKNDEALVIKIKNGVRTISEIKEAAYSLHFYQAKFCQRLKNQTFKQCYNKEVDEFCDSFVSCVALATNPTVSMLIAVACSCNA